MDYYFRYMKKEALREKVSRLNQSELKIFDDLVNDHPFDTILNIAEKTFGVVDAPFRMYRNGDEKCNLSEGDVENILIELDSLVQNFLTESLQYCGFSPMKSRVSAKVHLGGSRALRIVKNDSDMDIHITFKLEIKTEENSQQDHRFSSKVELHMKTSVDHTI